MPLSSVLSVYPSKSIITSHHRPPRPCAAELPLFLSQWCWNKDKCISLRGAEQHIGSVRPCRVFILSYFILFKINVFFSDKSADISESGSLWINIYASRCLWISLISLLCLDLLPPSSRFCCNSLSVVLIQEATCRSPRCWAAASSPICHSVYFCVMQNREHVPLSAVLKTRNPSIYVQPLRSRHSLQGVFTLGKTTPSAGFYPAGMCCDILCTFFPTFLLMNS